MPQDSTPFVIFYKDTSYTVYSLNDYNNLPDSVKTEDVRNQFAEHEKQEYEKQPAIIKYEDKTTDSDPGGFLIMLLIIAFLILRLNAYNKRKLQEGDEEAIYETTPSETNEVKPLVYYGKDLRFSDEELNHICNKYNFYYQKLKPEKKIIFAQRLKAFIASKNFYIYGRKGYKEMPVLISAAAIQITFGLSEFLLPYFKNIIIHPDAYLADNPLRVLMGNVQGPNITLSWKHFLEDYQNPTDGKNVGLHEMAHALQVQYLFLKRNRTNEFKEDFEHYDRADDEVLQEKDDKYGLFDKYALRDKNELWATSIELFFEKPVDLKLDYPELYESIKLVLNQDPLTL